MRASAWARKGPVGLITYMRTDSTNLAASAVKEMRDFIKKEYGAALSCRRRRAPTPAR